ncbi:MAG TPA: 5-formyltetrahydrofolate cyclo-ligase [Chloroflexota bacterium]|nr:5-formyltetrahydrofolate cyclo-ligase [Chloroflexota bacterium]
MTATQTPQAAEKAWIRERIWALLEAQGIATFPRPVAGRIPNFRGAEQAAARLTATPAFAAARTVKINPDAPQRPLRYQALQAGKRVLVPTPRLRGGFYLLDPAAIPPDRWLAAASIAGFARYGQALALEELPPIDLVVMGAVAVAPDGARVGKGEGYAELEYAILRTLGRVAAATPVCTTVHDAQLVAAIPVEPFDVPVDLIATPTRLIPTATPYPRPDRVLWDYLPPARLAAMPVLAALRAAAR